MILDFRSYDLGRPIETDLCIIGAGAAGITIAQSFVGSGVDVCLLESGGFEYEERVQSLYQGESVGYPYYDLTVCRTRQFGGTTNVWSGHCTPLAESDFEVRPWVPHSGWPIRRSELERYFRAAQTVCELGPFDYEAAHWADRLPAFDPAKLESCLWQFSPPTRFGELYRPGLERSVNVRVYLHATVAELETDETATSVIGARIRTLDGGRGVVRARCYVLAASGIENARILLLSKGVEERGLGNRHDLVGRFFMDHPHAHSAVALGVRSERLYQISELFWKDGLKLRTGVAPTRACQRSERILNGSLIVRYDASDRDTGYDALRRLGRAAQELEWPDGLRGDLWKIISDIDEVAKGLRSYAAGESYERPPMLWLFSRSEQAPNPNSRVTLSNERDALGMHRVQLDWQLSEIDRHTIRRLSELFGEELGRLGLGRLKLADWLLDEGSRPPQDAITGGEHHVGTTRMADDPKQGVVDRSCRVHGTVNLFVAGSSVFPTAGYANPTLTLVALSLRLADELKARLLA